MYRSPQSRRFWRILGPILGYWGIQVVAQIIVAMVMIMLNAGDITSIVASANEENMMEKVMEISAQMTQFLLSHQSLVSAFIAGCTIPLTWVLFVKDRKAEKALQLPADPKVPFFQYGWIALFAAAFCLCMNVIIVMSGLAKRDTSFLTNSAALYSEGIVVMLACQGVLVPIAEELMFRGILYKRCREQMGFWNAAFTVSCFFALVHGTLTQLAYTLVLGLFLAYFYEKFGSLKAPILMHMAVNIIAIVITKTEILLWLCTDFMRMSVCVVGSAFIGAAAFVRIQRIEKKA